MRDKTKKEEDWSEIKGRLKKKFALLKDSDLLMIDGKYDEMLGRLQVKFGKTKEEIQKLISEI